MSDKVTTIKVIESNVTESALELNATLEDSRGNVTKLTEEQLGKLIILMGDVWVGGLLK